MYRLHCGEIWGGIRNREQEAWSAGVTAALYSSACEGGKGGDIYYLSVCESDLLTRLVLADVVGHGPAVSAVSQWLFEALRAHMNNPASNHVLAEVNRLATHHGLDAMATAAIVAFNTAAHRLDFAYAGHPPALVKRTAAPTWCPVELEDGQARSGAANVPLGITDDARFDQQALELGSGDRVCLYTDGVIEAPDQAGEVFGVTRLQALLAADGRAPLAELRSAVVAALRRHSGGVLHHDDVTFVLLEIR